MLIPYLEVRDLPYLTLLYLLLEPQHRHRNDILIVFLSHFYPYDEKNHQGLGMQSFTLLRQTEGVLRHLSK